MATLLLHGLVRRIVTRVHRWTGLVIMACMLVATVTGVWLTFRVELDRLVNPDLRTVQPGATAVSLTTVATAIAERFPNTSVHAFILQDRPDDSISAYLDAMDGSRLSVDRVFYDPYTAKFLGGSNTQDLVFARANVDTLIDRLHYSLWIKTWGLPLMGIVAGVWLLTSCVGLALAWPRAPHRIHGWRPVLSVRTGRGTYQLNYQLHRAIGVWFFPVLIVLAFTSFYQNMPQYVRPVVNAFSPLAEPPSGHPVAPGASIVTPDHALASLRMRFPEASAQSVGVDRAHGRYSILFRLPGDVAPNGDNWAFIDLVTGDIVAEQTGRTQRAGDTFLRWIFPLHTGTAFGLPGRIVIAVAGIGLAAMLVTGFYVWGMKWRMRRRTGVTKRLLGVTAIAVTVVSPQARPTDRTTAA